MLAVAPAGDGIRGIADGPDLVWNQVGPYVWGIQVVQDEDAFWSQGGADRVDGVQVFALRFEVPEAGEKIEGEVKAIGAKQAAHIMDEEMDVLVRELVGEGDGIGSQVDTCYVVSRFREDAGVPAPAASDIQQEGTGWGH